MEDDIHGKITSIPATSSDYREKIDIVKALADTVELVVTSHEGHTGGVLTKECASEFLAFGRAPLEARGDWTCIGEGAMDMSVIDNAIASHTGVQRWCALR